MNGAPGTILFLLRNLYYLRNFEAPIRALLERGHRLVILTDPAKFLPHEIVQQVDGLKADFPETLSFGDAHGRADFRRRLVDEIHTARDVLRYHTGDFAAATALRRRAVAKATPLARFAYDRDTFSDPARNRRADHRLAAWDAALPPDRTILAELERIAPDVLVVSPLVDFRSDQIDWVRAARARAIPTVLAVASWDNLTNKSRIQVSTDRILVWNETQRREAIELHGVADETIIVTGAQLYDEWFGRKPSRDRQAFCALHDFDPGRQIILYTGSSTAITDDEPAFIRRWLAALRASPNTDLAVANVLIRPHPMNYAGYRSVDLAGLGPAAIAPPHGGLPVTEERRADYFDALFHCTLVVGLNTSALIEASILGKPCFTVQTDEHRGGQQQTLHYHYLTAAKILSEAPDLEAHFADLATALHESDAGRKATDAFVTDFIRPYGRDAPATPRFVTAVEDAMHMAPANQTATDRTTRRYALDALALASQSAYDISTFLRRSGHAVHSFLVGKTQKRQTISER